MIPPPEFDALEEWGRQAVSLFIAAEAIAARRNPIPRPRLSQLHRFIPPPPPLLLPGDSWGQVVLAPDIVRVGKPTGDNGTRRRLSSRHFLGDAGPIGGGGYFSSHATPSMAATPGMEVPLDAMRDTGVGAIG